MELISSFPERLKEAMGGMSVTELATSLEISKQSVSAYLNGTRKPKRFVIAEISKVLGVNPPWLLGYDAEKYPPKDDDALTLTPTEETLVTDYRRLTPPGQEYIRQTMAIALQAYSEKNHPVSDLEAAQ